MAEDQDNILYRPVLEPERNYRSESLFDHTSDITYPDVPETEDQAEKLIDDLEELKNVVSILPSELPEILTPTIDKLIRRIQVAFPDGYYGNEEETQKEVIDGGNNKTLTPIASDVFENKYSVPGLPCLFPKPTNIAVTVEVPRTIVNIAIARYKQDTIDLQKRYLTQLQNALQNYFHQLLMVMADANASTTEALTTDFDSKAVSVPSGKNLEHLKDYISRSQVVRKQKTNLFKKTHNVDQTVMHMRRWHASEKERERYYSEAYGEASNYLGSESNLLLEESRSTYDKQYAQSLYDMYKYLNSSVIITKDILDMSLKESKAKGALVKAGVNIYASSKTKSTTTTTKTTSTTSSSSSSSSTSSSSSSSTSTGSTTSSSSSSSTITVAGTSEEKAAAKTDSSSAITTISNAITGK